jgi:hypothetical protein
MWRVMRRSSPNTACAPLYDDRSGAAGEHDTSSFSSLEEDAVVGSDA